MNQTYSHLFLFFVQTMFLLYSSLCKTFLSFYVLIFRSQLIYFSIFVVTKHKIKSIKNSYLNAQSLYKIQDRQVTDLHLS
ncbi:hypothetical protein DKZ22_13585, partial [Limosilactobacillus reuteri]